MTEIDWDRHPLWPADGVDAAALLARAATWPGVLSTRRDMLVGPQRRLADHGGECNALLAETLSPAHPQLQITLKVTGPHVYRAQPDGPLPAHTSRPDQRQNARVDDVAVTSRRTPKAFRDIGVSDDALPGLLERYKPGATVEESGFTSASTSSRPQETLACES